MWPASRGDLGDGQGLAVGRGDHRTDAGQLALQARAGRDHARRGSRASPSGRAPAEAIDRPSGANATLGDRPRCPFRVASFRPEAGVPEHHLAPPVAGREEPAVGREGDRPARRHTSARRSERPRSVEERDDPVGTCRGDAPTVGREGDRGDSAPGRRSRPLGPRAARGADSPDRPRRRRPASGRRARTGGRRPARPAGSSRTGPRGEVPEQDPAVDPARGEDRAVGRKATDRTSPPWPSRVATRLPVAASTRWTSPRKPPEGDRPAVGGDGQARAVAERAPADEQAGGRVVDGQVVGGAGRVEGLAVGRERDAEGLAGIVEGGGGRERRRGGLPELDRPVVAGRGEPAGARGEGQGRDAVGVAGEGGPLAAGLGSQSFTVASSPPVASVAPEGEKARPGPCRRGRSAWPARGRSTRPRA